MSKTLEIRCSGKVQGVFYRASAKTKAEELGLSGWVRNEYNGDVLIHATGNEEMLTHLVEWCREGPDFATVDDVQIREVEAENFDRFEIIH